MPAADNRLIALLPRPDRLRMAAAAEAVPLVAGERLCERGDATRHVLFPASGVVSLLVDSAHAPGLEVGMVGREGLLGVQLVLGVPDAPLRAQVLHAGEAWRVGADDLAHEMARSAPLRTALQRYLYVLMAQQAAATACMRYHQIGPRLARWLLMSLDRSGAARLHVTHELLACLLGVRRVGITMAAGALQRRGLIAYHRGDLAVLDRPGLEAAACSCYAADRRTYAALLR